MRSRRARSWPRGAAAAVMGAAVLWLPGCSASQQGKVSATPDLIERQEIDSYVGSGTSNLHELIQRARPRWLESRGERSLALQTVILVYLNQQRLGGIDALRDLRPDNVVRIRRLDASRAGLLPGARDQHVEAAIVVETTRG
jgi:hypothetical protein